MKPEPYLKATNANSSDAVIKSFTRVPLKDARIAFECDRDGRNLFARAVYSDGSYGYQLSGSGEPVQILSLKAASVSEFWLKAYAAGRVFEEDDTAPKEPEREISRLKDQIAELESKIRKYRDTIRLIYSKSESF